jgi:prevent-host-death family protein
MYVTDSLRVCFSGKKRGTTSGATRRPYSQGMPRQLQDFGPPKLLHSVTTEELRSKLSETINRAAFGVDPVLVTRRGRKIAAIISLVDLVFLENMKKRREEIMTENVPDDMGEVGPAMGRRLKWEIFFGRHP